MIYKEIKEYFEKNKIANFRFKQLEDAIFKNFVNDFSEITNFTKELRDDLKKNFKFSSLKLNEIYETNDTIKFLLETEDKNLIEVILMIHKDSRRTVCVSSQIFCSLGCKFCATGAQKFKRDLTTTEIVEQVLFISKFLKNRDERVSNIVFMGMGEPFLNYENVIESIEIFNDKNKFNIGARHITVSTSGIIPKIIEFSKFKFQTRLAISLHAPNEKLRSELMPINNKYPLISLIKSCDEFTKITNKRISYEYVLIKDINDSKENALELSNLLNGKLAHVNLLIYNPHEFADFKRPSMEVVNNFKNILINNGIETSIRKSMGDDISSACGQLSGKKIK